MITIPTKTTKAWNQTNSGDVFGNLFSTKNINFNKEGYLSLADKTRAYFRTDSSGASFDQVLSIVFSPVGDLVVTSDGTYEIDVTRTDSTPLTINADSGVQSATLNGDAIAWNGRIYQTGSTATKYWDGSNWSSASIVLTASVPHPMCVFESLNYLAVATNKNIVKLYDTSHSLVQTLTIPAENEIQWMVYRDSNLYIGTASLVGKNGRMYVWNGASTSAQKAYDAKGEVLMSGCEYMNSIATVSSIGQVLLFNGGGFTELGNFPVYYTNYKWTDTAKRVARRGMVADGNLLYINIEGQVVVNGSTILLPNQPSGLWCYDSKVGLYHKGGFSSDYPTYNTINSISTATNTLTLNTAVETQTGEPVFYTVSSGLITGLVDLSMYYAIRTSSTQFQLAETYDDAINGTAVDLTADPGAPYGTLVCPKGNSYGNTFQPSFSAGAVALIPESRTYWDFYTNRLLYSGWRVADDSVSTTYSTLQGFTPGENRGSFVTQKIWSNDIEDVWNKAVIKTRGLLNSNDKCIMKYRTTEKQYYPITPFSNQFAATAATWTTTSAFTVTSTKFANVVAGEEVEIVSGAGAGVIAHINTITNNAGTYTITIDETLPLVTAGDTSYIIVDNWIKGSTITSADTKQHKLTSINLNGKWLQLKVELRGDGTQVEELQVVNKVQIPTV